VYITLQMHDRKQARVSPVGRSSARLNQINYETDYPWVPKSHQFHLIIWARLDQQEATRLGCGDASGLGDLRRTMRGD
jgi:hypothetical protein